MKSLVEDGKDSSVLVSSHNDWIQPFMVHLATTGKVTGLPLSDELKQMCSPNTGLTKLTIAMDKSTGDLQSAHCHLLYCAMHLEEIRAISNTK